MPQEITITNMTVGPKPATATAVKSAEDFAWFDESVSNDDLAKQLKTPRRRTLTRSNNQDRVHGSSKTNESDRPAGTREIAARQTLRPTGKYGKTA